MKRIGFIVELPPVATIWKMFASSEISLSTQREHCPEGIYWCTVNGEYRNYSTILQCRLLGPVCSLQGCYGAHRKHPRRPLVLLLVEVVKFQLHFRRRFLLVIFIEENEPLYLLDVQRAGISKRLCLHSQRTALRPHVLHTWQSMAPYRVFPSLLLETYTSAL